MYLIILRQKLFMIPVPGVGNDKFIWIMSRWMLFCENVHSFPARNYVLGNPPWCLPGIKTNCTEVNTRVLRCEVWRKWWRKEGLELGKYSVILLRKKLILMTIVSDHDLLLSIVIVLVIAFYMDPESSQFEPSRSTLNDHRCQDFRAALQS